MSLNFSLSPSQVALQRRARELFAPLLPRRIEIQRQTHRDGDFPEEVWVALTQAGYFACLVDEARGGNGIGLVGACLVLEELAAADLGNILPVVTAMGTRCILNSGSAALADRVLPSVARGGARLAFGLTERKSGYNIFNIDCRAEHVAGGYRLNGEKAYVTAADVSGYVAIVARTMDMETCKKKGLDKTAGLSLFLLSSDMAGIVRDPVEMEGVGVLRQYRLRFNDVLVAEEDRIGAEGAALFSLLEAFNIERFLTAALGIGMSRFCIELGCREACVRSIFGSRPIGSYQAVQHPLAEARLRLEAARMLVHRAAWGVDNKAPLSEVGLYSNAAKVLTVELSLKAVDAAMDAFGGRAFEADTGLVRMWNAARAGKAVPVSDALALSFVAEHTMGLPRAY